MQKVVLLKEKLLLLMQEVVMLTQEDINVKILSQLDKRLDGIETSVAK